MQSLKMAIALAAALTAASPAGAQTANSSPTAPAPNGLVRTPPPASTTGPSGGRTDPSVAARPSQTGDETPVEKREEKKSDQDMTICKGC